MPSSSLRATPFASLLLTASLTVALAGAGCGDDSVTTGSGAAGPGGGGTGGAGGGTGCGLEQGEPIVAPPDTWTWVDFPDSTCMNGSATGIGINPSSTSKKVVIFLMGGNACFNTVSCAVTANPMGYDAADFAADDDGVKTANFFDRADPNNPLRDFSYVFVPYCSGDVHAGDRSDVMVGNQVRQFKGFRNVEAYLKRLTATFPDAEQVLLAGVSAGGFGAAFNYDQVASAFCETPVVLVDDSGPPMGEEYLAACLQKHMLDTWGLATTLPADCADCVQPSGVFAEPMVKHMLAKYPTRNLALLSSEEDATIRQFWGYGENDCASLSGAPAPYLPSKYTAGLVDLRDRMTAGQGKFRLFMIPGDAHVLFTEPSGMPDPTMVVSGGINLRDWLLQALNDDPSWSHAP